jgi:DNA-binding NtrC family response regulator
MHAVACYRGDARPHDLVELAREIRDRSVQLWGENQATEIVGVHPTLQRALYRVARFARSAAALTITGETGSGKELFARALYLLSPRVGEPFLGINCAQYQDGQLISSELFGHKRGSFTGALGDHRGLFESASGGVVFLDEVGELSLATQAMLLRLLSEGEIVPVGETRPRKVDVRVVVATNRDLKRMVEQGSFRADLFYRLRYLHLRLPALRERGEDWRLILEHHLRRLGEAERLRKRFSDRSLATLDRYSWPGNVREVRGVVDTGFHLSEGAVIELEDFVESLEDLAPNQAFHGLPPFPAGTPAPAAAAAALLARLISGEGTFWSLVHEPYLDRDLKRIEVRELVAEGLKLTQGSYKRMLELLGLRPQDYLKFMDFLRHHKLKPPSLEGGSP